MPLSKRSSSGRGTEVVSDQARLVFLVAIGLGLCAWLFVDVGMALNDPQIYLVPIVYGVLGIGSLGTYPLLRAYIHDCDGNFIGISGDIGHDMGISLGIAGAFGLACFWNQIPWPGTAKTGLFASALAALDPIWQGAIVIGIAPIIEMAVFHYAVSGVAKTGLETVGVADEWARALISILLIESLGFALFHFWVYGDLMQTSYIGAYAFSVLAGITREKLESQIPGWIMHITINGFIMWGAFVIV